jgi:hypothetical protein
MGWLSRWRGRRQGSGASDAALALAGEAQGLRLELAERDRLIQQLQADLLRQREGEASGAAQSARAERQRLLGAVATPLQQLATQTQLDGVDAASMAAVAQSLLRGLADEGLELVGRVGTSESFDPARHEPLSDGVPGPDGPVVVRVPGLAVNGTLLRRAGVQPVESGG